MMVVCFFFALCAITGMNTEDPEAKMRHKHKSIDIKLVALSGATLDEFRLESTSEEDVKNKLKAKVDELNSSFSDKRATLVLDGVDIMKGGEIQVLISKIERVKNRSGAKEEGAECELFRGAVRCNGHPGRGGDPDVMQEDLNSGVKSIVAAYCAFAALKEEGKVVAWGSAVNGGYSGDKQGELNSGVENIFAADFAFAALKEEGKVVAWGDPVLGGNPGDKQAELNSGVKSIVAADYAFAALKEEEKVVTWGDPDLGGNPGDKQAELNSGVKSIVAADNAFAALKEEGKVVAWGHSDRGGNTGNKQEELKSGVVSIESTGFGFRARKEDGTEIEWGSNKKRKQIHTK